MSTENAIDNAVPHQKEKRTDLVHLDPRDIIVTGENPRNDYGSENDQEAFKQSIKENGVKVPISVYKENGQYYLINGERRLRACMALINEGVAVTVPATSKRKPSLLDLLTEMYVSNDGKVFTAIEECVYINRLSSEFGLSGDEIAARLGKTAAHVSNMKKLFTVPDDLKDKIASNDISATLVLQLLKEKDEDGKTLTVDEVVNLVNEAKANKPTGKVRKADVDKAKQKYNSLSILKKLVTNNDKRNFAEGEGQTLYRFMRDVFNGKVSEEKVKAFMQFMETDKA